MKDNLFINLKKYRPRDGHTPLENFITEAFAWILNYNTDFSRFYFQKITEALGLPVSIDEELVWNTQVNFGGVYPDVVVEYGDNKALIFEHKAWAELHPKQLENYSTYAQKTYKGGFHIILITATQDQWKQKPDKALCWSEIVDWMEYWQEKNNNTLLISNFIALIKNEGMGSPAPITKDSMMLYHLTRLFESNLEVLFNVVNQRINKKFSKQMAFFAYNRWERVGIGSGGTIADDWIPGLFFGVILNSQRHGTNLSVPSQGNDFVVMLTFDKWTHKKYPQNENYKTFTSDLQSLALELGNDWHFSNHIQEELEPKKNYYHPIQIRKPLAQVLDNITVYKEQEEEVYKTVNTILLKILGMASFHSLREDMRNVDR